MKWIFFIGGWIFSTLYAQTVSSARFRELARDTAYQKLDVRTGVEFDMVGHIHGFMNINSESPVFLKTAEQTFDKNKPILVTCFSGHRSTKAVQQLRDAGFTRVIELQGGIIAWMMAGYPLE